MSMRGERGYAMAALLVGMSVMAVMLSVAMPTWRTASQREREAELVFRGEQYARAVTLFQRRFPGQFPPSVDVLLSGKFLRKRYRDPMTEDGEFQPIFAGQAMPGQTAQQGGATGARGTTQPQPQRQAQGTTQPATGAAPGVQVGIMGVVSKSTADSMRLYNGRGRYNEWAFVATQASTEAGTGARGGQVPGGRGGAPPGRGGGGRGTPARGAQPPPGRGQTPLFPPAAGRGRGN